MSFDINPPSRNLSNVQASAKSQDGGGGNTGYFERDGQNQDEKEIDTSTKLYPSDSFQKKEIILEEDDEQSISDIIKGIFKEFFEVIKSFFSR